jgi:curli biogenesis system outer membrane secretion channel CsgG
VSIRSVSAIAFACLFAATAAHAQNRPRIAVLGFDNNTSSRVWGDRLGEAAADELTTQLVKTGDFSVLERAQIQKILDEQLAGQSGAIDPATAAKVGKLIGIQFALVGSITQFSIDEKSGGIGRFSASYSQAESMLDVRVVDVSTGEILVVAEGQGIKRFGGAAFKDINLQRNFDAGVAQEALRPAVESAIAALARDKDRLTAAAPVAAMAVVGANDGAIYVDRGENGGLQVGQKLDVLRVVHTIRDASGNVLDEVTEKVGTLEVTRVLSQSSICRILDGDVKEGDKVRPAG